MRPESTILLDKWLTILWLTVLLGLSNCSFACKPALDSLPNLRRTLISEDPSQIVFFGKVVSVKEIILLSSTKREFNITYLVQRQWRGKLKSHVVVRGSINETGNTCQRLDNFHASVGQKWLFVGYKNNGIIYPSRLLSQQVHSEKNLPPEIKELLGEGR